MASLWSCHPHVQLLTINLCFLSETVLGTYFEVDKGINNENVFTELTHIHFCYLI
jgi:hypothetical protein